VRGWKQSKKGKTKRRFLVPNRWAKKTGWSKRLGSTSDSVGQFRRYQCSTLFNYDKNISMCGTCLIKLLSPREFRGLTNLKETHDLSLSAVSLTIWSLRTPTTICCTKELYNPGLLPSAQQCDSFTNKKVHIHASERIKMPVTFRSPDETNRTWASNGGSDINILVFPCTEVKVPPF